MSGKICRVASLYLLIVLSMAPELVSGEIVPLQGLNGNTLVAGKTTAFRMYSDAGTLARVESVTSAITRPDGSQFNETWTKTDIVFLATGGLGPSLVVRVMGTNIPWVGTYQLTFHILDRSGATITSYSLDSMELLPTKDLIVGMDIANSLPQSTPPKPSSINPAPQSVIDGATDALKRIAAIMPVRDGISTPDGDKTAGFRYIINNKPQSYGCNGDPKTSDCQSCPFFASQADNKPANTDIMNLGMEYRAQNPGEGMGGIAPRFCTGQKQVGQAHVVMNAPSAPGLAQESGHVFGAEPTNDPHFDPTVQAHHSKDNTIASADSDQGFDTETNAAFPSPTYDAMHQVVCGCPNDSVAYNTWDWEYLRTQFVKLSSTGPGLPNQFHSDAAPSVAGASHGVYFFGRRADSKIAYNYALVGQAGTGWKEVDGNGRSDTAPASAAGGGRIFVAIKGADGHVLLNQTGEGKPFGAWFPMNFVTDVAPAVAVVENRVFVIAKGVDRRIYAAQAVFGQAFSDWFELQGGGQTDSAPSAAAIGNHIFVAIKGLDGRLQLNQADLGAAWSGWSLLNMTTNLPPGLAAVENRIFAFATATDGRILLTQAVLGQAFSPWVEVQGSLRSRNAPAAAAVSAHIFVSAINGDGSFVTNQAELGHAFGAWF
jgi:hypothetical protein